MVATMYNIYCAAPPPSLAMPVPRHPLLIWLHSRAQFPQARGTQSICCARHLQVGRAGIGGLYAEARAAIGAHTYSATSCGVAGSFDLADEQDLNKMGAN